MHQKALEITIRLVGGDNLDVAKSYNNVGAVYESQDRYEQALDMARVAIACRQTKRHLSSLT